MRPLRTRKAWAAVASALASLAMACEGGSSHLPPAATKADPAPQAVAAPPVGVSAPPGVTLPEGKGHPLDPTALMVVIARDAVRFPVTGLVVPVPVDASHGVDGQYKRSGPNDLYIVPLADALRSAREKAEAARTAKSASPTTPRVVLLADQTTPYRLLTEVLFTVGQSLISDVSVGVRDGAQVVGLDLELPPAVPPERRPGVPGLRLAVMITADGIAVKASGENVAPGCKDVGPGITLRKVNDAYDLRALTKCVTTLKRISPDFADETRVIVAANPAISLGAVASAIAAVRTADDGAVLFPIVRLGVAR